MRAAILVLVVGCGASPPVAEPNVPGNTRPSCELQDHGSTRRAWLVAGVSPVTVLDLRDNNLRVATVRDDVIVTRWVPLESLAPVVREKTAVSPRPGTPGDPAIQVLAGFRLPKTTTPWIAIHADRPVEVSGFIPAITRGIMWDEPVSQPRKVVSADMTIRAEPRSDGPVRGVIHSGAQVRVIGLPIDRAPWVEVQATGAHVTVAGFVEPPPPPPPRQESELEFSEESVEGSPHAWWPIGTCLYDEPGGQIVGQVIGAGFDKPQAGANGWSSIVVPTGWGDVRYHASAPVVEPLPAATVDDWKFSDESRWN